MRYGFDGRCISDHFPGIGRYAYELARRLPPLAPEDTFLILYDPAAVNSRFDLARLAALPNATLVPASAGLFSLRQHVTVRRLARRLRLDLYHSPYYGMPLAMPCPVVLSLHDLIPWLHPESTPAHSALPYKLLVKLAAKRAEAVLVLSRASRRDVIAVLGADPAQVHVVQPAADAAFSPCGADAVRALAKRLRLDRPYVLYLGINKPHKNLVRLIEAWAMLPGELLAGHCLVLAGPEDARYPEARLAARRWGLEGDVRFLGPISDGDLPALYSGAEAFVFPSRYEGFGLRAREAMACGAPVACSRSSSLPEVVGDDALLFDPEDVDDLRAALRRLLTEPDLRQRLAQAGPQRAAQFSWERAAHETLAIYRRVVGA
jgi:glycosyltransferase involved in cell wall biosynthesis